MTVQFAHGEEVDGEGIASCGDYSISDCKTMALAAAKRDAAEKGSRVFISSSTLMQDYALTSDIVQSSVKAKILGFEVLENGLLGETGYRYLIRARVTPDFSESFPDAKEMSTKGGGKLPAWIFSPKVKDAFAASSCVPATGSMNLDRRVASANARAELAQRLMTRIIAMDETIESLDDRLVAASYTATTRSLASQSLRGSMIVNSGYFEIDDVRHFCAMVSMPENGGRELFENILEAANLPESSQGDALYESFLNGGT
ncbi:MAG: hypothetical protein WD994_05110 [Pseudomonadales bacterium]